MRTFLLCCLLGSIAPNLSVALDFRVVSWSGQIGNLKFEGDKGKPVTLAANESVLSRTYHFSGVPPLILYREEKNAEKVIRVPVASLTVPPDLTKAILVLAPADASGKTYSGLWLDDSLARRPINALQFRNLSKQPVAIKLGEANQILRPREVFQAAFDANAHTVPLTVAVQADGAWQLISTQPQPVRSGFRILVLLRDGRELKDGTIPAAEIMTLYDSPPTPPAGK